MSQAVTMTVPATDVGPVSDDGHVCDGRSDCVVGRTHMVPTLRRLIDEGNIRRIWVKDTRGRTIIEVPVRLGEVGDVHAPLFTTLEALSETGEEFAIVIQREDAWPERRTVGI